jgi:acyl-CoA reductase-like NAD-dependent aldehyde dehydrogenase
MMWTERSLAARKLSRRKAGKLWSRLRTLTAVPFRWKKTTGRERAALFLKLADLIEAHPEIGFLDTIATAIPYQRDPGSPMPCGP